MKKSHPQDSVICRSLRNKKIRYKGYKTPVGTVYASCERRGVSCCIAAVFVGRFAFKDLMESHGGRLKRGTCQGLRRFGARLKSYFSGKKGAGFGRVVIPGGSDFDTAVWSAIAKIPYGSTRTYKEIAAAIGRIKACRAVANACGRNPLPLVIPCHRVVAANGLGGYSGGGVSIKKKLLGLEGALIGLIPVRKPHAGNARGKR